MIGGKTIIIRVSLQFPKVLPNACVHPHPLCTCMYVCIITMYVCTSIGVSSFQALYATGGNELSFVSIRSFIHETSYINFVSIRSFIHETSYISFVSIRSFIHET